MLRAGLLWLCWERQVSAIRASALLSVDCLGCLAAHLGTALRVLRACLLYEGASVA